MHVVAANLWNINPKQLNAIQQCLAYDPDIIVLPELRNSCISAAEKLLLSQGYDLACVRVHKIMSLGVASRIPTLHREIIDQGDFSGRPQLKLRLENGMTFFGIHLDAPVSPYRCRRRQRQLSLLAKFIDQTQEPVVLAGDFNTYFNESIFQRFLAEINSLPQDAPLRLRTWPAILPIFQIDHILCNQSLKVSELQKGKFNGSDHLPIHARVSFK